MPVYVSDLLTATAAPVNAVPTATRTWQWLRGSTAISGATSSTYTAVADDIGATIAASQIETNVAGTATATSAPTEVIQAFDPIRLFSASEPGVWYDPNDISTLFKGTTNLTPVTAPGDTVSAMLDKSRGLVLGPQLVNNGTFAGGTTGWDNITATLSVVDGEGIVTGGSSGYVRQSIATVVGKTYQVTCLARKGTSNSASISIGGIAAETTSATATPLFCLYTATGTSAFLWLQVSSAGTAFYDDVSVKELPGNHATQSITASQPIYGIVPAGGRRNLVVWSEDYSNAAWVKTAVTVSATQYTAPDGTVTADLIYPSSSGTGRYIVREPIAVTTGATCNTSLRFKAAGIGFAWVASVQGNATLYVNLTTGATSIVGAGISNVASSIDANNWVTVSFSSTLTVGANASLYCGPCDASGSTQVTASGTNGILIWGAQLELGTTATPYQRVTTQYDVTEAGVASLGYLYFDGSGDFMSTGTITPGTDKVQVFTGVRKLSDVEQDTLIELGTNSAGGGSIGLWTGGPISPGANYHFNSSGTAVVTAIAPLSYPAPITNVLTGLGDISGDSATLRVNGAQVAQSTADQGTGNYLANIFYIGRRAGTSFAFNGHIHSLIVRFGPNLTTARISATESWVASKTAGAPAL